MEGYHYLTYERICGYSLGNKLSFYSTLDDAKANLSPEKIAKSELRFFNTHSRQDAIVEFEISKDDNYVSPLKLYTIQKFEKIYDPKRYYVPEWSEREITNYDLTRGARDEISRQYQEHVKVLNQVVKF